ncbi:hypothetical protein [Natrinema amylolyticum]|uniref:hypothetical protein n=1 Tax=Natrinema amylolyticum TaxID=2878679 RepID=UPI001CFBFD5F|nr:hypothetical protein [Natrinema amylolyticum]
MTETTHILLRAENEDAADRLIREYVVDAIDRLPETDPCDGISFAFDDHPETGDSSVVALVLDGKASELVETECGRWDALVEKGFIEGWEQAAVFDHDELGAKWSENYLELSSAITQLSTEMTKDVYETFDAHPAAVDTFPDENDGLPPVGWWTLVHHLTNQQNYSLEEELRAYEYGIEHTLRNSAEYDGETAAAERLDQHLESLESKREEIREGRLDS